MNYDRFVLDGISTNAPLEFSKTTLGDRNVTPNIPP